MWFEVEFRCQSKDTDITTLCQSAQNHITTTQHFLPKELSSWVTGWIQGDKSNNTATFDTFIPKRIEDFPKSIVPCNFYTFHITRTQISFHSYTTEKEGSRPTFVLHTVQTFHYLPTVILIVILIIIGIPSHTHSFTLGLNLSFSANPPYCSLFFFSFRFHYMDFPDCLLLLLSISVFLLFSFFSIFTLF